MINPDADRWPELDLDDVLADLGDLRRRLLPGRSTGVAPRHGRGEGLQRTAVARSCRIDISATRAADQSRRAGPGRPVGAYRRPDARRGSRGSFRQAVEDMTESWLWELANQIQNRDPRPGRLHRDAPQDLRLGPDDEPVPPSHGRPSRPVYRSGPMREIENCGRGLLPA